MNNQNQQVVDRIKQANSVLVTVSSNPSVDQLAACIGLTLTLNKMGKHATAVFSGNVPSTIEFLQPEKTIEKTTDSLRDFIIALDKSRADKLRYKVEDKMVKIFITPYRTSISEKDLEFSQGDFNVDVVLALGVHNQADIDQAITSHGRILHDATIVTINIQPGGELGGINWVDTAASSLSELSTQLVNLFDKTMIDAQIATAFLTGIVAATNRFSNTQTYPQTMSISAELMAAGADQQLVAAKLEEPQDILQQANTPAPPPAAAADTAAPVPQQDVTPAAAAPVPASGDNGDGTLDIPHETDKPASEASEAAAAAAQAPVPEAENPSEPQEIHIDEHGSLSAIGGDSPGISHHAEPPKIITEPPTMGAPLTAATQNTDDTGLTTPNAEDDEKPSGGPLPSDAFLVGNAPAEAPAPPAATASSGTLADIEREVHSPHADQVIMPPAMPSLSPPPSMPPVVESTPSVSLPVMPAETPAAPLTEPSGPDVDSARNAVEQAINAAPSSVLPPIEALNAQSVDLMHTNTNQSGDDNRVQGGSGAVIMPETPAAPVQPADEGQGYYGPTPPPPVPPPMMPPNQF